MPKRQLGVTERYESTVARAAQKVKSTELAGVRILSETASATIQWIAAAFKCCWALLMFQSSLLHKLGILELASQQQQFTISDVCHLQHTFLHVARVEVARAISTREFVIWLAHRTKWATNQIPRA